MNKVTQILLAVIFIAVLFTQCNTPKHTMSVTQLDRIAPTPIKIATDTTRYTYIKPNATPPKLTEPKDNFEQSYQELKAMLQGTQTPDFERAVYLSENPYHNNQFTYEEFRQMVDMQLSYVQKLIKANDKSDTMNFDAHVGVNGTFKIADMRFLPKEKKELYRKALSNWAIFTYITDTLTVRVKDTNNLFSFYHLPFAYTTQDPFGKNDWTNTQVINLLTNGEQGNCFSLTALFKILSNRLNTGTRLCTAPQHVYLQHRDTKGDYYNVELATAGFPRDGTLQTLTYTTDEALKKGIALRDYTERQSIGLCMVNLAKSYEHYYETQTDTFLLQCAETILQYDSLNLSALLLKQQVLDERVTQYAKQQDINSITQLKQDKSIQQTINDLEKHTTLLYRLGYLQMPLDMQQIILSGNYPKEFKDQNPSPYTNPRIKKEEERLGKYSALYGGLFKEVFELQPTEEFRHFTFDTKTKKLKSINLNALENELIDPVAFAYDFGARFYDARLGRFTSVDPLSNKYPQQSPYSGFANNPILFIDEDGKEPIVKQVGTVETFIKILNSTPSKMGLSTGADASKALLKLGSTEWSWKQMRPLPTTTPYFNNRDARYIYTEKGGWVDMVHFLFYAGKAYDYKLQKMAAAKEIEEMQKIASENGTYGATYYPKQEIANMNPVEQSIKDGYHQELSDKIAAKYSAYSYEDLPTDKLGAEFGANYFDPNSKLNFGEQVENYLNSMGATDPKNAPNFDKLPTVEPKDKPTRTNTSTKPVYTKDNK